MKRVFSLIASIILIIMGAWLLFSVIVLAVDEKGIYIFTLVAAFALAIFGINGIINFCKKKS